MDLKALIAEIEAGSEGAGADKTAGAKAPAAAKPAAAAAAGQAKTASATDDGVATDAVKLAEEVFNCGRLMYIGFRSEHEKHASAVTSGAATAHAADPSRKNKGVWDNIAAATHARHGENAKPGDDTSERYEGTKNRPKQVENPTK